jgi:hypothetical protein
MRVKIKDPFNLLASIVGFVLMLVALVFLHSELIALPFSAIGGSILATVIVNYILIRKWHGLPITLIAEALASKTKFMRMEQEAELIFEIDNGLIKLKKRHKYSLENNYIFKKRIELSMFTDSPKARPSDKCGFQAIIEPDGKELIGEALKPFIKHENGKHIFCKEYKLDRGHKNNQFEFHSVAYYRLTDRLIWTVQELSDGFNVRIINKTGIIDPFEVKINHHKECDISVKKTSIDTGDGYEKRFEIYSEILPYQGFEIMWEIPESL